MFPLLLLMLMFGDEPKKTAAASLKPSVKKETTATLEFAEMYTASARELKPSEKLQSLHNKQVRVIGFMAEMEDALTGGFYLTPLPCHCDESGGGTGDIPPQAIRVVLAYAPKRELPHANGRITVVGRLEVGAKTHAEGQVSHVRLVLDEAPQPSKRQPRKPRSEPLPKK